MSQATNQNQKSLERQRIVLGILESVEQNGSRSQRARAGDLQIALGLVNSYLKQCIRKGLVKMKEVPPRRYAYNLTPRGFAEKSKLTIQYMSQSLVYFRRAKADCEDLLELADYRGWRRLVLAGASDLAEIVSICVNERGVEIVAVLDDGFKRATFLGKPVVRSLSELQASYDVVVLTDINASGKTYRALTERIDRGRVLVPQLLADRLPGVDRGARG